MQISKALEEFWKILGNESSFISNTEEHEGDAQCLICSTCQAVGRSLKDHISKHLPPSAFKSIDLGSVETLTERTYCSTCQQIVEIGKALSCGVGSDWRAVIRPGFSKLLRLHYSGYGSCPPLAFDIRFTNGSGAVSNVAGNAGTQYILKTAPIPLHPQIPQMNIMNPQEIDIGRLRRLLDHCNTYHCRSCHHVSSRNLAEEAYPLYLIDVNRKCLVSGSRGQKYVALSYLWGAAAGDFKTICSNLDELLEEDSLSPASIRFKVPRTIRDAMRLTIALGQEFLWVDRYSIVQDDEATKEAQIQGMASIYGNAAFTVIAAEGDNPHYGLSGISMDSHPPRKQQRVLRLGPECQLVEWAPDPLLLASTTWGCRAWTFQESLISRRKIIFHNGRVEWRCQHHLILEDCNLPFDVWSYDLQFANLRVYTWPNLPQYVDLVQQYCQRQLSYDDDALAAFAGVLDLFSQSFPGSFHFGLPELYFDISLLWQPRYTIRQRYPFEESYAGKRLPSWSWVRWHGQLDMSLCHLEYLLRNQEAYQSYSLESYCRIYSILEWHKVERGSGRREKVNNSYALYRDSEVIPNGWSRHPVGWLRQKGVSVSGHSIKKWYEEPSYCYHHVSDPVQKFWYPIPISPENNKVQTRVWEPYIQARCERAYLQIRTSSVNELHVLSWEDAVNDYSAAQEPDSPEEVCLIDDEGQWMGILRLNGWTEHEVDNMRCELIAISRGVFYGQPGKYEKADRAWLSERRLADKHRFGPVGGFYEFYNVLWIEWHDGIAYRKALGRVEKKMWERQRRETIDVTLG
jgi:hypothetical protein